MAKKKTADRIRDLFNKVNSRTRTQWEYINQKGFDFANDNQLTENERIALEEQGMPTFTINRIMPVVEMLNFYATANDPRWQAVGADGSDTDVAAVFSDISDYVWYISDGSTLYANAINDAITKSTGYLMLSVDHDSDQGMGDVKVSQPEPFDVFVDPKSRDMLFRDASFIMVRKILPEDHLMTLFPGEKRKIKKAASDQNIDYNYSEKSMGNMQKDFTYKDITESETIDPNTGDHGKLLELLEVYEKIKVPYVNVFHKVPPDEDVLNSIQEQVSVTMKEMAAELEVKVKETKLELSKMVESGEMIQERYDLEVKKAEENASKQLEAARQELMSQMQAQASKIENTVITQKEFNVMVEDPLLGPLIIDAIHYHGTRIKQTLVIGNQTLYEKILPELITEYPIVPFHYKWTGTPFPVSAVSPLIGKQREMNKAHQVMLHNASLGSSLRWMHEEGSIDTDYWEKYSSSPGALLPIRPGAVPPTAVQPAPLSNAFFQVVQEGKQDMEYLAGIFGAMQGDTSSQHDTYKGMLATDEYGTRRVKQWLANAIEPALKQLGKVMSEYTRTVYTANKVFRIVQPNAIQEEKTVEINVPMYNDLGEEIGKWNDYASAKFDVRIVPGSTLPVNRWAYLAELKELMQLGVIDDIALLAETDIRNKEELVERKSMYSQLQGQISGMEEQIKNAEGTIETLERQLVQAGIKNKVMQASVEVDKKRNQVNASMDKQLNEAKAQNKLLMSDKKLKNDIANKKLGMHIDAEIQRIKSENKNKQ